MLKKLTITLLLAFAMSAASAGTMTLLEEAAEFDTLSVRVSKANEGQFQLKPCDECVEVKLYIAPSTQLNVKGKPVPLSRLNKFTLRSGTVFYNAESGLVTRIEAVR